MGKHSVALWQRRLITTSRGGEGRHKFIPALDDVPDFEDTLIEEPAPAEPADAERPEAVDYFAATADVDTDADAVEREEATEEPLPLPLPLAIVPEASLFDDAEETPEPVVHDEAVDVAPDAADTDSSSLFDDEPAIETQDVEPAVADAIEPDAEPTNGGMSLFGDDNEDDFSFVAAPERGNRLGETDTDPATVAALATAAAAAVAAAAKPAATTPAPAAPPAVPDKSVVEVHVVHHGWSDETTDTGSTVTAAAPGDGRADFEHAGDLTPAVFDDILNVAIDNPDHNRPRRIFGRKSTPSDSHTPDEQPKPARKKKQMDDIDPAGSVVAGNWLKETFDHAIQQGASDLKLTSDGRTGDLECRIRIDGTMRDYMTVKGEPGIKVLGKFKADAALASGGSHKPEETRMDVDVDNEKRIARIAVFRTSDGGNVVSVRLPPTGRLRTLDELEFGPDNLTHFRRLLRASNRMVIVAGPMGAGKTTTVHGALHEVATSERNVYTIEDPVERVIPGTTQLEVDDRNGAGFADLLPTLVRSDYDTLFLGEIRDRATAEAGVRQAKAGKQVLTTIHANNNVTALLRLIELSEDSPLSVLDSVKGVVSQRLVRRLNPAWDGVDPEAKYKGRVPIHEVLTVQERLIEAFMRGDSLSEINAAALEFSAGSFRDDANRLIAAGVTDETEIQRVIGE